MAHWQRSSTRAVPLLRQNELENLYVFGYQCKLFQDDEKATYVDQGRHLIPWMGDPTVMIDRYDGRGHLHDLQPHDAERVSHVEEQTPEEEQKIEALCEEERYLELHTDLVQKAMYEEEELKRLNEAISDGYSAVGFNYNMGYRQEEEQIDEEEKEEDEPYYAPPELQLPTNVVPPSTVKLNAIIEKTALFVSKQGSQMEIMIKTKQRNNQQFEFLEYGTALNPYYKHMVKMLKSGKYKPHSQRHRQNSTEDYLHPSLTKTTESQPVIKEQTREEFMHSVSSKLPSGQIENTSYALLLNNLTKHTGRNSPKLTHTKTLRQRGGAVSQEYSEDVALPSVSDQDVYSGLGQMAAYEYHHTRYDGVVSGALQPPVPGMEPVRLPHAAKEANGQPPPPGTDCLTHGTKQSSHSLISTTDGTRAYIETEPETASEPLLHTVAGPPPHTVSGPLPLSRSFPHRAAIPHSDNTAVHTSEALGHLPHGSEHNSHPTEQPMHGPHIIMPPSDILPVIDKMAVYVSKNGPEFELIVQRKHDERFNFLNAGHDHNPYYEHKKKQYQQEMSKQKNKEERCRVKAGNEIHSEENDNTHRTKHHNKAISFSLRAKDVENIPAALRTTALLYESSEEEDDGSCKEVPQAPAEWLQNPIKEQQWTEVGPRAQTAEELEKKQAEVRVKDRLALAARDKLAQASRENQIKAERKRKAAMFINMLKSVHPSESGPENQETTAPVTVQPVDELPISAQASPQMSCSASPVLTASAAPSQNSSPVITRSTRSPSVPHVIRISRSRSKSPKRRRSKSPKRRRSRSPLRRRKSRSRSPRRRKQREITPPSAYNVVRRSVSPGSKYKARSRSRTPARYKRPRRSRSKEKIKPRSNRSRSRSRTRGKSPSRSRKRSRSKSKTRSKRKSRSRSRTRKRSSSRSKKSKSKKSNKSPTRSPKHKRTHNDDKKSDKKSRSKYSSHRKSDKVSKHKKSSKSKDKTREPSSERIVEDSPVIHHIEDSPSSSSPVHHDGGIISDSSSPPSSPEVTQSTTQQIIDTDLSSEASGMSPVAMVSSNALANKYLSTTQVEPGFTPALDQLLVPTLVKGSSSAPKPVQIQTPKLAQVPSPTPKPVKLPSPTPKPVKLPPPAPKPVLKPPPAPSIDMFAD